MESLKQVKRTIVRVARGLACGSGLALQPALSVEAPGVGVRGCAVGPEDLVRHLVAGVVAVGGQQDVAWSAPLNHVLAVGRVGVAVGAGGSGVALSEAFTQPSNRIRDFQQCAW